MATRCFFEVWSDAGDREYDVLAGVVGNVLAGPNLSKTLKFERQESFIKIKV